jgi:hypothetical protein
MKNTTLIAMMAVSISVAGCGKSSSTSAASTPPKQASYDFIGHERTAVAHSQMVAYCTADTNSAPNVIFTVSEIWKGAHDALTLGITNGTQFPLSWGKEGQVGPCPDAAILIVSPTASRETALESPNLTFIRDGRVGTNTLQEFKSEVGLQ